MLNALNTTKILTIFIIVLFYTNVVFAIELNPSDPNFRFNNTNWFTTPHPAVLTFSVESDGSANGTTTSNIPFSLKNIPNTVGLRIQKFIIQDHFHYIIAGNIVYTLPEISANLASAYGVQK